MSEEARRSCRVCGCLSGTSADAIDVVLCEFPVGVSGRDSTAVLLAADSVPMPPVLRAALLAAGQGWGRDVNDDDDDDNVPR